MGSKAALWLQIQRYPRGGSFSLILSLTAPYPKQAESPYPTQPAPSPAYPPAQYPEGKDPAQPQGGYPPQDPAQPGPQQPPRYQPTPQGKRLSREAPNGGHLGIYVYPYVATYSSVLEVWYTQTVKPL